MSALCTQQNPKYPLQLMHITNASLNIQPNPLPGPAEQERVAILTSGVPEVVSKWGKWGFLNMARKRSSPRGKIISASAMAGGMRVVIRSVFGAADPRPLQGPQS